ncbi:MAG: hypothetical protein KBF12_01005 [Sebaldella sp.]|nr:hypothetical protein [Sebaldella sp.]
MKKLSIFLILLLVLSCSSTNKKTAKTDKTATATETVEAKPKLTGPIRSGQYYHSTGVFVYKKDRLLIKDKFINYNLVDETGLVDGIYEKLKSQFDIKDYEYINLEVQGEIKGDTFYVKRVLNYRAPEDRYAEGAIVE